MNYYLPCFGRSKSRDSERESLLPRHTNARGSNFNAPPNAKGSERSIVDKIVDVFIALENGKVPSQDQLSGFLRVLLKSPLLEEQRGEVVPGNGPTSKQGRRVLRDARALIQALLQFGMEKNGTYNTLQFLHKYQFLDHCYNNYSGRQTTRTILPTGAGRFPCKIFCLHDRPNCVGRHETSRSRIQRSK